MNQTEIRLVHNQKEKYNYDHIVFNLGDITHQFWCVYGACMAGASLTLDTAPRFSWKSNMLEYAGCQIGPNSSL